MKFEVEVYNLQELQLVGNALAQIQATRDAQTARWKAEDDAATAAEDKPCGCKDKAPRASRAKKAAEPASNVAVDVPAAVTTRLAEAIADESVLVDEKTFVAAVVEAAPAPATPPAVEDLTPLMQQYLAKLGAAETRRLLDTFGAARLQNVPAERLVEFGVALRVGLA